MDCFTNVILRKILLTLVKFTNVSKILLMLVNDFTNVSKILHAFKKIVKIVFFRFFLGVVIFFVMCVIVVCDDLVLSEVFPVEDFNRYVVVSVEESALMC